MLGKLALRNAKRSFKDYLVYMITITFAFALIFSFNAAVFSDEVANLSKMMESFKQAIIMVSVIIVFVIGWLINYTMRFMVEKRSKEFGTYAVLGISNKKITNIFFIENVILGLFALALAFIIGMFLYQVILVIIMNFFNAPYNITLAVPLNAILLTLLYFVIIFCFSLFKSRRKLRKTKVYDLLYLDKKNENMVLKSKRNKTILCIISILCGVASVVLLTKTFEIGTDPKMSNILIALILIIVCLYGFYIGASSLITAFFLSKKRKYRKNNLFLFRNFTSKINTMSVTLGTLALLFCLTFISMNVGMFMKGLFDEQIMRMAPYDISIFNPGDDEEFNNITKQIKKDYTIDDMMIYKTYISDSNQFTSTDLSVNLGYQLKDGFLRLSDYNKLREMSGLKPVKLDDDKYLIHTMSNVSESIRKEELKSVKLSLSGKELSNQGVLTKGYSTEWFPGSTFVIIVNDKYVEGLEVVNTILNVNTKEDTTEAYYDELFKYITPNLHVSENNIYSIKGITVKGKVISENKAVLVTFAFSLFYLAFIFTATAGTILSIQQLSDSAKYKFRYQILSKLGMAKTNMNKLIFKQLLIFFLFPVIIPLILSMAASIASYQVFTPVIENNNLLWEGIGVTTGLFFFIYIIYFIATYIGFKKNVNS